MSPPVADVHSDDNYRVLGIGRDASEASLLLKTWQKCKRVVKSPAIQDLGSWPTGGLPCAFREGGALCNGI